MEMLLMGLFHCKMFWFGWSSVFQQQWQQISLKCLSSSSLQKQQVAFWASSDPAAWNMQQQCDIIVTHQIGNNLEFTLHICNGATSMELCLQEISYKKWKKENATKYLQPLNAIQQGCILVINHPHLGKQLEKPSCSRPQSFPLLH